MSPSLRRRAILGHRFHRGRIRSEDFIVIQRSHRICSSLEAAVMSSTKRSRDINSTNNSLEPSQKRPCHNDLEQTDHACVDSITTSVLQSFNHDYKSPIDRADFVMLCGYLSCLLAWGYQMQSDQLDRFILLHTKYLQVLPNYEAVQCEVPHWTVPAYHQWFQEHHTEYPNPESTANILTAAKLRLIGKQNPCSFLIASMTLEYIQETRP